MGGRVPIRNLSLRYQILLGVFLTLAIGVCVGYIVFRLQAETAVQNWLLDPEHPYWRRVGALSERQLEKIAQSDGRGQMRKRGGPRFPVRFQLYDKEGRLLFHHGAPFDLVTPLANIQQFPYFAESDEGEEVQGYFDTYRQGQLVYAVFSRAPNFRDFRDALKHTRGVFFSSILAGLVSIGLLTWWLSGFLVKPLRRLTEVVRKQARDSEAISRYRPIGQAEIRELEEAFKTTQKRLSHTLDSLESSKSELQSSNDTLRQFLGDVSHNLRTPLTAIIGWSESWESGLIEAQEATAKIRREGYYVASQLQRLTDLARWQRMDMVVYPQEVEVLELLSEVLDALEDTASQRGLKMKTEGLHSGLKLITDRERARELLQIIIENAVIHGKPNSIIEIEVIECDSRLLWRIQNQGAGLTSQQWESLYQSFVREIPWVNGLGLACAYRIAQRLGQPLVVGPLPDGSGFVANFSFDSQNLA